MKRYLFVALFSLTCFFANAQKNVNYIGIGADLGIPIGDFGEAANVGVGGSLKFILGVSDPGQVTFTTGYSAFKVKGIPGGLGIRANWTMIPLLFGYRHNFNGVYLEPQLGIASYGVRASANGQSESDSEIGFTAAAGFGYANNGLDAGLRFQYGKLSDGDSPFTLIGFRIGYNIPLGYKRK